MVGLGETKEEIFEVMQDMRDHNINMLTIGQYLQPSKSHLPVQRYVTPEEFQEYQALADKMGFERAACGGHWYARLIMPTNNAWRKYHLSKEILSLFYLLPMH